MVIKLRYSFSANNNNYRSINRKMAANHTKVDLFKLLLF